MKKIISLILSVLMLPTVSVVAAPIYSDNVKGLLAELSIMQGDPDGNMRYDDLVSRAECTKMVVATSSFRDSVALGSKTSPFSDVPYTHWASPYVTVGIKNGLIKVELGLARGKKLYDKRHDLKEKAIKRDFERDK